MQPTAESDRVTHPELVMIATNNGRLPHPSSQRGDTLIEVLVSALLLAVIVVGTLTGLNSANRSTSIDRERSQADALAQQEEDQLRSEPIAKLSELSATHEVIQREVNASGTTYVISSTAQYISDATATSSCSSTTPKADYIQTTSKVTWHELGTGKPVVETSVISPPADSALIVQVTNQAGEPVPSMNVAATGATNMTSETSTDGCAILGVSPGEYNLNVSRAGYVDEDGFPNSNENIVTNTPFYVVAENTVKKQFQFAPSGTIKVRFENTHTKAPALGESFVYANTLMFPAFKAFPTGSSYTPSYTLSNTSVFPSKATYSAYAGTCEADNPHTVNSSIVVPAQLVTPGKTMEATAGLPPIAVKVLAGSSKSLPGGGAAHAPVALTDTGCGTTRNLETNGSGELVYAAPYGKYSLCVTSAGRSYTTTFANNTANGPSTAATMTNGQELSGEDSVIYMGSSAPSPPGKFESGSTCP
jgi:Tfp pilus assembly protein PilV